MLDGLFVYSLEGETKSKLELWFFRSVWGLRSKEKHNAKRLFILGDPPSDKNVLENPSGNDWDVLTQRTSRNMLLVDNWSWPWDVHHWAVCVWFSQHLWRTRSLGALSLSHYSSTGWLSRRVRGLHGPTSALVTAAFTCYPDLEKGQQATEIDGIWDRECIKSLSF